MLILHKEEKPRDQISNALIFSPSLFITPGLLVGFFFISTLKKARWLQDSGSLVFSNLA